MRGTARENETAVRHSQLSSLLTTTLHRGPGRMAMLLLMRFGKHEPEINHAGWDILTLTLKFFISPSPGQEEPSPDSVSLPEEREKQPRNWPPLSPFLHIRCFASRLICCIACSRASHCIALYCSVWHQQCSTWPNPHSVTHAT